MTVPVGTAGSVSLQLSGAMAHLRADVLGYVAAPPVLTWSPGTVRRRGSVRAAA